MIIKCNVCINRRQVLTSTGTVMIGVSIAGCSSGGGGGGSSNNRLSPEEVGRAYLTAYAKGEYSEAVSYAAGEEEENITEEEVIEAREKETEFEITEVEQSDRKAKITYVKSVESALGGLTDTEAILLAELNDGWRVVKMSNSQDISIKATEIYTADITGPISVAYEYVNTNPDEGNIDQFVSPDFEHPDEAKNSVQRCIDGAFCDSYNESTLEQSYPIKYVGRPWRSNPELLSFGSITEGESTTSVKLKYGRRSSITLEVILHQVEGEWKVLSYEQPTAN